MIYFVHIPKTGGTSIRTIIESKFAPEDVIHIYSKPQGISIEELLNLDRKVRSRASLIYGHFPFGLDKSLGKPGKYLTCLRETRSRLVSNYFHHAKEGLTDGLSIASYFFSMAPKDMDNYSVRLLSGIGHDAAFGKVGLGHLAAARDNLVNHFSTFGLLEYPEETISRFLDALGMESRPLGHENVTVRDAELGAVPDQEVTAVLRMNTLDAALYDFARERFFRGD